MAKHLIFLLCLVCMTVPRSALSYEVDYPDPPTDSLITLEDLGSTVHLYGPPNSGEFDIAASYPWFANVFNLYVSDLIPQQWD
ncbi:MAG: hypothetical protein ABR899_07950, partial [Candidatus Krumholzibacteriaceae bacterium]